VHNGGDSKWITIQLRIAAFDSKTIYWHFYHNFMHFDHCDKYINAWQWSVIKHGGKMSSIYADKPSSSMRSHQVNSHVLTVTQQQNMNTDSDRHTNRQTDGRTDRQRQTDGWIDRLPSIWSRLLKSPCLSVWGLQQSASDARPTHTDTETRPTRSADFVFSVLR